MSRECSICDQSLADSPRSGPAHARKHRNEFERKMGRRPDDYDEVRAFFGGELTVDHPVEQTALGKFA